MKLIDTNVVIYAMGEAHPYKSSCQRVFSMAYDGRLEASIDTELLQEVLHFYHRRNRLRFGQALFDRLLALFPNPFSITREIAVRTRDVIGRYPHLAARDAVHAAVVLHEGLEGIVSADRGFDLIPEMKRFDPADL